MVHRGEIVEKAVRSSGMSVSGVARKLGRSRRWMYDAFQTQDLGLDYILSIGKIIHYDFKKEIPELRGGVSQMKEPSSEYPEHDLEYWRSKYYALLEEYNKLLKAKI